MIWIAYAARGHELEAEEAIRALGIEVWVAKRIEMRRSPTGRRWRAEVEPFLPNYVFINCTDEQWHKLREVKHIAQSMLSISEQAARIYLQPFRDKIDADFAERRALVDAGEHVQAYNPGDMIELESGPLAGILLTFRRMVETDKPEFPKIIAAVTLFGKEGEIEIDPINVKRVAKAS